MNKKTMILAVLIIALLAQSLRADIPTEIVTGFDRVPVFGRVPTITAASDGNWNTAATWDAGRVPLASDAVLIPPGITVSVNSACVAKTVLVQGTLDLLAGSTLTLTTLMGLEDSAITAGTEAAPVACQVMFRDEPPNLLTDPFQFGVGLLSFGRVELHGLHVQPFVRLLATPKAGDLNLNFGLLPTGWATKDRLLIPESRQTVGMPDDEHPSFTEINRIAYDKLKLDRPLAYDHPGVLDIDGAAIFPHAVNLRRSIVLRAENPMGNRPHIQFFDHADVMLSYVRFEGCGRTSATRPLDNSKAGESGTEHIGTNQIGRYALHLHHLHHPFTITGCVVEDFRKWGIAVHDCHDSQIVGNVIHNGDGAGIVTEQGNETGNLFAGNFVSQVRGGYLLNNGWREYIGPGGFQIEDIGYNGSGYWFRGPGNRVVDNVAVDCFAAYSYNGYQRAGPPIPILESRGNEAYACGRGLWTTAHGGQEIDAYRADTFDGFKLWHIQRLGVFFYYEARLTFSNFTIVGDPAIAAIWHAGPAPAPIAGFSTGYDVYPNGGHTITNASVSGMNIGIRVPTSHELSEPENLVTLTDCRLKNWVNLSIDTASEPRRIVGTGITFISSGIAPPSKPFYLANSNADYPRTETDVWMRFTPARKSIEHNATRGFKALTPTKAAINCKRYFFLEQAAGYLIPALPGIPVDAVGKTNSKLWAESGRAIAGEIAPCETVVSRVVGFVCEP